MAGYDGFSKSNNAVAAQNAGILPLAEATKRLARMAGITQKKAREALVAAGPCEWHHCSKFYNKVDHYDVAAVAIEIKGRELCASTVAALPADWKETLSAHRTGDNRINMDSLDNAFAQEHGVDPVKMIAAYYDVYDDLTEAQA